jgi:hypothetical protein
VCRGWKTSRALGVAIVRGRDSAEVPREVTGVDGSSHTCASESSVPRVSRVVEPKVGIASEVASSDPPRS